MTKPNYITIRLPEQAKYLKNAPAFRVLQKKYQSENCYIGAQPAIYPCWLVIAQVVPQETGHSEVVPVYLYEVQVSTIPIALMLDFDDRNFQDISIVAAHYKDKTPIKWAIRKGGTCMSKKDGIFYYEPQPSSRNQAFFNEFRFDSIEAAEAAYISFHKTT